MSLRPIKGVTRDASSARSLRVAAILSAIFTGSCLLTISLDGLEGPPLSPDAGTPEGGGAGGSGGRSEAGADAEADGGPDAGAGGGANGDADGGDRTILDTADIGDGVDAGDTADAGDGGRGPFPVGSSGGTLRGLAEHGDDVYWVQGDPAAGIVRLSKSTGQFGFIDSTADAFDVAADDNYVYWSTTGGEVFRKPVGSTLPASEAFPGAVVTLYLAAGSAGRVYVTGLDQVTVGQFADGGTSYGIYTQQTGAAGIALRGADLFWSVRGGIMRGNDTGLLAARMVYASAPGEVAAVATDGREIFWITVDGAVQAQPINDPLPLLRDVCRANVDPGDADVDARPDGPGGGGVLDIAVDDDWVYFTEPAVRRISKCRKQ